MRNKNTKKLVLAAILAALAIVVNFTNFLPPPRLYLGYIPIMISGFLLGPFFGAATGIIADLAGYASMGGPFLPIFTLSSALAGIVPGVLSYYLFKRKHLKLWQYFVTVIIFQAVVIPLNLYGVITFYGKALEAIFIPRLIAALIMVPVFTVCVAIIIKVYYRMFPND